MRAKGGPLDPAKQRELGPLAEAASMTQRGVSGRNSVRMGANGRQ